MDYFPFDIPIYDSLLKESNATLFFSDEMTSWFAGGRTQDVTGRLFLSNSTLAFRCNRKYPHPQQVTISLDDINRINIGSKKTLGCIPISKKMLFIYANITEKEFKLQFKLDEPKDWMKSVKDQISKTNYIDPNVALDDAINKGIIERERYTPVLKMVSFPQTYWSTDNYNEIKTITNNILNDLSILKYCTEDYFSQIILNFISEFGPEDYEKGVGSDIELMRNQIDSIILSINKIIPKEVNKCFYKFKEDLPGWETDIPVWLYLTEKQRNGLLKLKILNEII